MADLSSFRFDGVISLPTVLAIGAACLGMVGAVASAQATATDAQKRILTVESKYEAIPERLASIEAYQKAQADSLREIKIQLSK